MRIGMIFSAALPPHEGIGFYVWNLSRQLVNQGHEVQLITRGNAKPTWCEVVDGIRIWRATFLPVYPYHVNVHGIFVQKLVDHLETQFDLLHLHSPLVHSLDSSLPVLVTIHTPVRSDVALTPSTNWIGKLTKLQSSFSYRIETDLFSRAGRLVATSTSVANDLREYGVDARNVGILGNGVDETLFYPTASLQPEDPPYLLTVSRLAPRKGLEDLIDCASMVLRKRQDIRFLIAGSGPLEKELKERIRKSNLTKNIVLLGQITDRLRLADLYRRATLYVHPAHYEGMATAILEAMACARPVVATAVGGALDNIQTGTNGFLVSPHQPSQMAGAILELMDDPHRCRRLGNAAFDSIQQRYTWKCVSQKYLAEYHSLLPAIRTDGLNIAPRPG